MNPLVLGPVFAHGVGGFRDLPIPKWAAIWSGGAALVISFLLLYLLWPTPRLARASTGKALASWTSHLHDVIVVVLRAFGLLLFATTLIALWSGSTNSAENIAPTMIYVIFWVGVPFASLLFGDLWQALNPFDTLAAIAGFVRTRVWKRAPEALDDDGTIATSYWPAVVGLFAFSWLELCYHDRSDIRRLGLIVTVYSVVVLAAAARYGRAWLRTGEAFSAYFSLIARMAPLTTDRETRRLRVRPPFTALSTLATRPGITMLVLVSLGGTTFDGISRTQFWQKVLETSTGWNYTFINTFGLIWMIGLVAIAYAIATTAAAWITDTDRYDAPARYVHTLVPIAFAYEFAHYFTFLLYEGQDIFRLMSNPFGRNWDLFGTVDYVINFTLLSPDTVSWAKIAGVIIGHIIAVTLAHDRAIEDEDHAIAVKSQIPMLAVMVAYTATALWLLLA
ncbi:MAG: hypothetical protein ABI658_23645 [Acidimicrobiales bacterium]